MAWNIAAHTHFGQKVTVITEYESRFVNAVKQIPLRSKSYDEWLVSRTPATRIQFWGLLLFGSILIAGGLFLLIPVWWKGSSDPLDVFAIALLSMCSIPSLAIIYYGLLHVKRALVRRQ